MKGQLAPVFDADCRVPVERIFAVLNIVIRVAVTESIRKDLIEHSVLDPRGLPVVRQQNEIVGLIRQVCCDAKLVVVVHGIVADNVELILHTVFADPKLGRVIHQTVDDLAAFHLHQITYPIWYASEEDVLYWRILIHSQFDCDCFPQFWLWVTDKKSAAVTIYALQPFRLLHFRLLAFKQIYKVSVSLWKNRCQDNQTFGENVVFYLIVNAKNEQ